MKFKQLLVLPILLHLVPNASASTEQSAQNSAMGVQINYVNGSLVTTQPPKTQQYGVQLQYFPKQTTWKHVQIFLQGGYEHLYTNMQAPKPGFATSANNYAIGPLLRVDFSIINGLQPYFVIGAQPGYLSAKNFGNRTLGSYFEFRDTIGGGLLIGNKHRANVGFNLMHYSHLFGSPNSGVTLRLEFTLAYEFEV